jgi:DNA-binding phage protein
MRDEYDFTDAKVGPVLNRPPEDRQMAASLASFDVTPVLDSDEAIADYLRQMSERGDADEMRRAMGYVATARGAVKIA